MPFKKGESGNPAGRPVGTGISGQARQAITERIPEILESLITQAVNGDTAAAKVLLDKTVPSLKSHSIPVHVDVGDTLPETGFNVVSETLSGNITPETGSQLIRALSDQSRLIELEEMNRRLVRIEQQLEARK